MNNLTKYILLVYTILNLHFFSYSLFEDSEQIMNGLKIINSIPIIILIYQIIINKNWRKGYFHKPIILFISSTIIGVISALVYYDQTIVQSWKALDVFYPFFTYLLLIKLRTKKDDILFVVKIVFWITIGVFIIDLLTFPTPIFAWRSEERETRTAIGIFFYGQGFTVLGALIYLNKYLESKKSIFLIPFIIASICIMFLTGSRIYLLALGISAIFMVFYFIYNSKLTKKKIYFITIFCFFIVVLSYFLLDFILNLINITNEQFSDFSNDVRYDCIIYYTTEFQKNFSTYFFGSGYPHFKSELGYKILNARETGFYESDIGLIGVWIYFGFLSIIAWIMIFWKVFNKKYIQMNLSVVAFFIFIFFNSFFVYTLFDPGFILSYIFALYLFKTYSNKQEILINIINSEIKKIHKEK